MGVVSGRGDFARRLRGDGDSIADPEGGSSVAGAVSPEEGWALRGVVERCRPRPEDLEFEVWPLVMLKRSLH